MGNYFNELRWKLIRSNNLLQSIHQVTIEFRFRKSLAQDRFKSNLEPRHQTTASSIKFRKGFAKSMIPIALFKKFLSQPFIVSVEVSNMARRPSKTNEPRDTDPIGFRCTRFIGYNTDLESQQKTWNARYWARDPWSAETSPHMLRERETYRHTDKYM